MSAVHVLKAWPSYFQQIAHGVLTFNLRNGDRDFAIGDRVWFAEWKPVPGEFTGRVARVDIAALVDAQGSGLFHAPPHFVVFGWKGVEWTGAFSPAHIARAHADGLGLP